MGYRNDIAALQERLNLVRRERDALRGEVEELREARDDAKAKIRREAYLRKELNKLRDMPEQLANSEIRSRQLEARIRELRDQEVVAPTQVTTPPKHREQNVILLIVIGGVILIQILRLVMS